MTRQPTSPAPRSTPCWMELGEVQRLLLDSYPGIVLGLDPDGRIRSLNPAGADRLGYGREELTGQVVADRLIALEELEARAAQLAGELGERVAADGTVLGARLQRGAPADEHDWVLRHKDGTPLPTRLTLGALRDRAGHAVGLLAVEPWPRVADADALQLATHDSLTGLSARAVLPDRAEMALQRAARQKTVVALMLVEVVGFDTLCESYGHSVGDDVLRATAGRLYFELRKTDTAVRLERGRFATMLVDLHEPSEALLVAGKIQKSLSAPVNVGVARIPLTVRLGLSWFPEHGDQLLPLLEAAEQALESVTDERGGVETSTAKPPATAMARPADADADADAATTATAGSDEAAEPDTA